MQSNIQNIKNDIRPLDQRAAGLPLHMEYVTDRNIQLIAENFIELTDKWNKAIPAADKSLAYKVKVIYLVEEVKKLKKTPLDWNLRRHRKNQPSGTRFNRNQKRPARHEKQCGLPKLAGSRYPYLTWNMPLAQTSNSLQKAFATLQKESSLPSLRQTII